MGWLANGISISCYMSTVRNLRLTHNLFTIKSMRSGKNYGEKNGTKTRSDYNITYFSCTLLFHSFQLIKLTSKTLSISTQFIEFWYKMSTVLFASNIRPIRWFGYTKTLTWKI